MAPRLEYFVYDKKTGLDISCSLTFDYDVAKGVVNVMTFYPNIHPCADSRYLSAVCFFMIMQHLASFYHINCHCRILLQTRRGSLIPSMPCSRILISISCYTEKRTGSILKADSLP